MIASTRAQPSPLLIPAAPGVTVMEAALALGVGPSASNLDCWLLF